MQTFGKKRTKKTLLNNSWDKKKSKKISELVSYSQNGNVKVNLKL